MLRVADDVIADGHRRRRVRIAPARDLLLRRPPRRRRREPGAALVAARRGDARCRAAARARTRRRRAADPGTAGDRQDLHRRPDDRSTSSGRGSGSAITAQSHKAISNLLEARRPRRGAPRPARRSRRAEGAARTTSTSVDLDGVTRVGRQRRGRGGARRRRPSTSSPGRRGCSRARRWSAPFDVLFVDEAGQMSLANSSRSAARAGSIVLLGDPNQLPQVSQGVHPDGCRRVGARAPRRRRGRRSPTERGLFLDDDLADASGRQRATSREMFYDGSPRDAPSTACQRRRRRRAAPRRRRHPVRPRRARRATDSGRRRGGRSSPSCDQGPRGHGHVDRRRDVACRSTIDDIIVVAPYNAQVAAIQARSSSRLGRPARVGTVDKFQGQEGADRDLLDGDVSSPRIAPRGMEFLYAAQPAQRRRSRGHGRRASSCASPTCSRSGCRTPEQMRLGERAVPVRRDARAARGRADAGATRPDAARYPRSA